MIVRMFVEVELDDTTIERDLKDQLDPRIRERELAKGLARQTQLGIESFNGVKEARVVSIPKLLTGGRILLPVPDLPKV